MKRVLSYSLYGSFPKYCAGMVANAKLAPKIYPEWQVICYAGHDVPPKIIEELKTLRVEVRKPDPEISNGMMWRLLPYDDPDIERLCVRDTDSRLCVREKIAVDAWIGSGLDFHSMADHPGHNLPIMGCSWSIKKGAIDNMRKLILSGKVGNAYNDDQLFMARCLWPLVENQTLRHDSCTRRLFPWAKPFPTGCRFGDWRFVGEIFDEHNEPHPHHWQMRVNYMTP